MSRNFTEISKFSILHLEYKIQLPYAYKKETEAIQAYVHYTNTFKLA